MMASTIAITAYILGSLGYYTIAKVRHIKHAWLAWVPVGNSWLLGSISDQYQLVKNGKKTCRGILLLVLDILYGLSAVAMIVLCVIMIVRLISAGGEFGGAVYGDHEIPEEMMGVLVGVACAYVVLVLSMIPLLIMRYIALYDVFQSCDPGSSVLYLVLSIFLGISPFLVFACRYKDLGMPRKNAPQPIDEPCTPPERSQPPKRVPWEFQ